MSFEANVPCPHCGVVNEVHEHASGATPQQGDLALCWDCKELSVYVDSSHQRKLTQEEYVEVWSDPQMAQALYAAGSARTVKRAVQAVADNWEGRS